MEQAAVAAHDVGVAVLGQHPVHRPALDRLLPQHRSGGAVGADEAERAADEDGPAHADRVDRAAGEQGPRHDAGLQRGAVTAVAGDRGGVAAARAEHDHLVHEAALVQRHRVRAHGQQPQLRSTELVLPQGVSASGVEQGEALLAVRAALRDGDAGRAGHDLVGAAAVEAGVLPQRLARPGVDAVGDAELGPGVDDVGRRGCQRRGVVAGPLAEQVVDVAGPQHLARHRVEPLEAGGVVGAPGQPGGAVVIGQDDGGVGHGPGLDVGGVAPAVRPAHRPGAGVDGGGPPDAPGHLCDVDHLAAVERGTAILRDAGVFRNLTTSRILGRRWGGETGWDACLMEWMRMAAASSGSRIW